MRDDTVSRLLSRDAPFGARDEGWDPLSYSAEIATAGVICAILMLIVIALP